MDALRTAAQSRAMHDVIGVTRVLARNYAEPGKLRSAGVDSTNPPVATVPAPVRIVSVVRGEKPHLVAIDGVEYPVGADVPGRGKLLSIGESAHVISSDGVLHKIVAQPVTTAELALAAEQQAAADAAAAALAASDHGTITADLADDGNAGVPRERLAKAEPPRSGKKM